MHDDSHAVFFHNSLKDLSSSAAEQKKVQSVLNFLSTVLDVTTLIREVKKVSEVMQFFSDK